KRQVEEFQKKLGIRSPKEVIDEPSKETGKDGQPLMSFRFLGVNVQRRKIGPDGTPLTGWEKLDIQREYRPYRVMTAKDPEPEDPKYDPIRFTGLVMPKLKEFREDETATPAGTGRTGMSPERGGSSGPPVGSGPFGR